MFVFCFGDVIACGPMDDDEPISVINRKDEHEVVGEVGEGGQVSKGGQVSEGTGESGEGGQMSEGTGESGEGGQVSEETGESGEGGQVNGGGEGEESEGQGETWESLLFIIANKYHPMGIRCSDLGWVNCAFYLALKSKICLIVVKNLLNSP